MPVNADSLALDDAELAELPDDTLFEQGVHESHFDSCKSEHEYRQRK